MDTRINLNRLLRRCILPLLGLSLLAASGVGHAVVVNGGSSSYGEWVNLTVDPLIGPDVTVTSGPVPTSAGTAPAPYNDPDNLASVSVGGSGISMLTGLLTTNASSDIDGTPGYRYASADASVANLSLGVTSFLGDLLGLKVGLIQSSATIGGDYGALTAVGTTTLADVFLSVPLGLPLDARPAPNTHVAGALLQPLGVSLILNEQILSGDGLTSRGLEVNAIHLAFTGFVLGLNVLNGDVIIGHSEAQVSAVPAPPALLLLGSSLLGLLGFRRRAA